MKARSFSHTGITVSDFNRAVKFYWDVFGAPLVGVSDAPADRVRGFFGVDHPSGTCRIGARSSPVAFQCATASVMSSSSA